MAKDLVSSNEITLSIELNYDLEKDRSDGMEKLNFVGNFQDRMKMRKKMINRVLKHYENDEDMYEECIEMFINMEEDLVV